MATRTLTDTATISWDEATANQQKGNVVDDSITNAKLANMATQTIKGRSTAGTGDPEDLTGAQVAALLPVPIGAGFADFPEIAEPASPLANVARFYARDVSSRTELAFKTNAGQIIDLLRGIVRAADFGAVGDGTTNDTAAIQAAIDFCEAAGGGEVHLDAKTYSVTDLLIEASGVALVGKASGRMFSASALQTGTILKARSGTTTLLTTSSPAAAGSAIAAVRVESMVLDGNGIATRSLFVKSLTNSIYRNLVAVGSSAAQIETSVVSEAFAGLNTVCSCAFENIWIVAATTAKGLVLSGDPGEPGGNRTIFCRFDTLHLTHVDGTALEINDADNNSFFNVGISRASGSGVGIDLIGDDADAQDLVHANLFYFVHPGPGSINAHGSKAINNVIFGLGTEDAIPDPTQSASAELHWIKDNGELSFPSLLAENSSGGVFQNKIQLVGSIATGGVASINGFGNDTDISIPIVPKGAGNVVINNAASVNSAIGNIATKLQVIGASATTAGSTISRFSADSTGPSLFLTKSRNATPGSHTIVQNGDIIGSVQFGASDGATFQRGAQIHAAISGTPGAGDLPTDLLFSTTPDGSSTALERVRCDSEGRLLASAPLGGIGYRTGAGGAVTQLTSKSTGVTLDTVCGQITMNNASLAANTTVTFTLTNSAIAATDQVICEHISGGTLFNHSVRAVAGAGSAVIHVRNITAGAITDALVLKFTVVKSVNA